MRRYDRACPIDRVSMDRPTTLAPGTVVYPETAPKNQTDVDMNMMR
jgi:hypothetical protein